jgi:hypothetical protein
MVLVWVECLFCPGPFPVRLKGAHWSRTPSRRAKNNQQTKQNRKIHSSVFCSHDTKRNPESTVYSLDVQFISPYRAISDTVLGGQSLRPQGCAAVRVGWLWGTVFRNVTPCHLVVIPKICQQGDSSHSFFLPFCIACQPKKSNLLAFLAQIRNWQGCCIR